MATITDLTHPLHTGMPAWHELGGRYGLAKCHVPTWDDYEETAYLRTQGQIPRLFRTCLIVMSDNGGTHVDATSHFNPLGEPIDEVPLSRAKAFERSKVRMFGRSSRRIIPEGP